MSGVGVKKLHRKRMFVNPDKESSAFVNSYVDVETYESAQGPKRTIICGYFKLADCDRVITLDIYAANRKELRQTVRKFENVRDELNETLNVLYDAEKHL